MKKNSPQNVLVISAHPDDEVLGAGGTMAKHILAGDNVTSVILAEGMTSRDVTRDRDNREDDIAALRIASQKAHDALGVTDFHLHDFPDNRMDSVDLLDVVKIVEDYVEKTQATIVYSHHRGDVNIDHHQIHDAVVTACRPLPGSTVKKLLFFQIASSTEWRPPGSSNGFLPNYFVDISNTLDKKITALEAYSVEMRPWPHTRSIKAVTHLAHWNGATVGVDAAEAFILGRDIQ
ncbi:PIG-L family deacetylase [bacterium]|jgi:N-acetylglucosamine malate deacetylase 1|nr:PIG-L family deacetylase [bacterium]